MSALEDFGDLMGTNIVVSNASTAARSMFGVQPYSTAGVTYKCHLMESDGSNRKLAGIDEHFSLIAWIANTSTSAVRRDSIFKLPDGSRPPVKAVTYPRDELGNVHHTKVVFG